MDRDAIERLIKAVTSGGSRNLVEPEAKGVLAGESIPVPEFRVVGGVEEAKSAADLIGYPVVLKVVSRDILHKTDAGGVMTDIKGPGDLESAFSEMVYTVADNAPGARIEGYLVERMAPPGVEVIVGAIRDDQFGPVVMFGMGGAAVELLKDTSFRLAPVTGGEAKRMMAEVKAYGLLKGFRGGESADLDAAANVIVGLSKILDRVQGISEIEINPLVVYRKGVMAVDARAVLVY